ncbi:MAG TPA: hypothetical protein PKK26_05405 [Candidatus Wallbacteria bacterium]|nr:hypothetical protein [Candidatus Wallbacteria bacterium]
MKSFFQKYLIIFTAALVSVFFIAHGYVSSVNSFDARIAAAEKYYPGMNIEKMLEGVETNPGGVGAACETIRKQLQKSGIRESAYVAMHLTKKSVSLMHTDYKTAKALIVEASKFSAKYEKAYLYNFLIDLCNFKFIDCADGLFSILYINFLSPEKLLKTMNSMLFIFIAFIFTQVVFFGSIYAKYRRLVNHEAYELGLDASSISIKPYLDEHEKRYMSFLNKNITIGLIFIVFYCYFSTGFGKMINTVDQANEFLKNPCEFYAMKYRGDYSPQLLIDFASNLKGAFEKEKYSNDFYYYLAGLSRQIIGDRAGKFNFFSKIPNYSFLKSKVTGDLTELNFLNDGDLYFAFFSPVRSNPVFMISVLLNVLLIIIFSIIINRARREAERCEARICSCGTVGCAECSVHVGLCNYCLEPVEKNCGHENAAVFFYPMDAKKIYYMSLFLPGMIFFYFSNYVQATFYSFILSFFAMLGFVNFIFSGPYFSFELLFAIVYLFYYIENYIFVKQKKLENQSNI